MNRLVLDLRVAGVRLSLGRTTRIMGIVNCTPDSFSNDGQFKFSKLTTNTAASLRHARKLIREGADIIDIGGESTRPGASRISIEEETRRVIPVIKALVRTTKVPISVDTSKLEVARAALDAGAVIVNNVMSLQADDDFLKMVRDYEAAIVLMHMRGTPLTMQSKARYKNVVKDVTRELRTSIEKCLAIGIKKDRMMIDPGIGFAKTMDHNLILIKHLNQLNVLGLPILLGASRKSFIGKILDQDADGRLMGTAATVVAGVIQGAHIVRVHDVKAIKETLKVTDAILAS